MESHSFYLTPHLLKSHFHFIFFNTRSPFRRGIGIKSLSLCFNLPSQNLHHVAPLLRLTFQPLPYIAIDREKKAIQSHKSNLSQGLLMMSKEKKALKASSSRVNGIRTLFDLNCLPVDSDSDSDDPQEYYTDGEKRFFLNPSFDFYSVFVYVLLHFLFDST